MNSPLSPEEMALRIFAATLAGTLVGLERESHGRPAGLRTTILTCVASAVAMVTSEFLFIESATAAGVGAWRPDPARLGAGILTGIGFLGAGTILRQSNLVIGVTTAASLWFVTVLGLAFGSGLYALGSLGLCIALVTLFALPHLERHIPDDAYATVTLTTDLDAVDEQQLQRTLQELGLKILRVELQFDFAGQQSTITCDVKMKRRNATDLSRKTIAGLRQVNGVRQIKWT